MITIDLYYLIQILLPPVHRSMLIIDYIKASIKPLSDVLTDFYSFFDKIKYELQFNGQVCLLEHLLNDQFDDVDRGIYITDAVNLSNTFIFNAAEGNEPTYLFNTSESESPVYLFNESEIVNYDFIVNIPASITYNAELLKFYVNKYKCAAKRWKIEII